jgi:hypothetical protein
MGLQLDITEAHGSFLGPFLARIHKLYSVKMGSSGEDTDVISDIYSDFSDSSESDHFKLDWHNNVHTYESDSGYADDDTASTVVFDDDEPPPPYASSESDIFERSTIYYPGSDGSDHGTVEEFIAEFTCSICNVPPTSDDAVSLTEQWINDGLSCVFLEQDGELDRVEYYVVCSRCQSYHHHECLVSSGRITASSVTMTTTDFVCHLCT